MTRMTLMAMDGVEVRRCSKERKGMASTLVSPYLMVHHRNGTILDILKHGQHFVAKAGNQ